MEKNLEIFHDVAWNNFLRFIPARVHLLTHSLANVVAHFTPILMQLVTPSHGFYCDFTHFPTPSNYDPFHSLAHMTNKQGIVYGYCKKCLLKCIGDGESRS